MQNKVYCKVNSQSEIDEILKVAKENGVKLWNEPYKDVIMLLIEDDNELQFAAHYPPCRNDCTELSYTDFINNLKSNNMNDNEIKIPDGYNVGTYDLTGVYITTKIPIPVNKEFVEVRNNTIILKDKKPRVKPLIEYIKRWYKRRIGMITCAGTVDNWLSAITKGEAIDILSLISNDLNGDCKENNYVIAINHLNDYTVIKFNSYDMFKAITDVFFKDQQTAEFVIENYIDLLNKIKDS